MSLPTSVVITVPNPFTNLQQALDVARNFKPLTTASPPRCLPKRSKPLAKASLRHKTTKQLDGPSTIRSAR